LTVRVRRISRSLGKVVSKVPVRVIALLLNPACFRV
jgi:hypothetical protein